MKPKTRPAFDQFQKSWWRMKRPTKARIETTTGLFMSLGADRVKMRHGGDIEHVVSHDRGAVDRSAEIGFSQLLLVLSGGENVEIAVLSGEEDLAVSHDGGAPDARLGFMNPVGFPGLGVEAVELAGIFGDEE